MGFFGIGTWELGLIMVVALIVFGPGKLPEVAGQMGKAVRDFRRMTSELTGEFEKTINEAQDIKNSVTGELTGIKGQVANVTSSVKKDLNSATGAAKSATATKSGTAKPATAAKRSVTAAKTAAASAKPKPTNGANKAVAVMATKADPLADVSEMDDEPVMKRPSVSARQAAPPPATAGPERAEALARARQRRLATTYTKKRPL